MQGERQQESKKYMIGVTVLKSRDGKVDKKRRRLTCNAYIQKGVLEENLRARHVKQKEKKNENIPICRVGNCT